MLGWLDRLVIFIFSLEDSPRHNDNACKTGYFCDCECLDCYAGECICPMCLCHFGSKKHETSKTL